MEILAILLIFSLGVIMLIACFVGGIAFTVGALKKSNSQQLHLL